MPKPKVVKTPQQVSIPSSKATRALNTIELASNWQDENGMITVDEGQLRVFNAAAQGGLFTVCTRGMRLGQWDRLEFRSFAAALPVFVHYNVQKRLPLMYAAVGPVEDSLNRDGLIAPGKGYKDKDTGKFVQANDATANILDFAYRHWCDLKGFTPHDQIIGIINILRSPMRIKRERLPDTPRRKIKRERL